MGIAAALVLTAAVMPAASAAALPSCSKGTKVQTVKGKSTMIYKGKRVACKAATAKPTASPTLAPSLKPEIRFSGGKINDLVIKPNLTITLRNFETGKRTLVITGTDYNFQADVVDPIVDSVAGMGAFMSPAKPGTYTMYFLENPSVKATLTVIP
jgi:hypothetical protein